MNPKVLGLK